MPTVESVRVRHRDVSQIEQSYILYKLVFSYTEVFGSGLSLEQVDDFYSLLELLMMNAISHFGAVAFRSSNL